MPPFSLRSGGSGPRRVCSAAAASVGLDIPASIIRVPMTDYRVRIATLADAYVLVRHRVRMFDDMGMQFDHAEMGDAFRRWMEREMPAGVYYAWVVEHADA